MLKDIYFYHQEFHIYMQFHMVVQSKDGKKK